MTVFCQVSYVAIKLLCVAFCIFTTLFNSRFLENYCKQVEGVIAEAAGVICTLNISVLLAFKVSSQEYGRHHAMLRNEVLLRM